VVVISSYNKECDEKIVALNIKRGEMVEQNKNKILNSQVTIQQLHEQNDQAKEKIIHTDVGTFKFIAKNLNIPLDSAVNYFILMIMIVFDPLAVVLVLAYNIMVQKEKEKTVPSLLSAPTSKEKNPVDITTTTLSPQVVIAEEQADGGIPIAMEVVDNIVETTTTETTTTSTPLEIIEETTTTVQPDPYSEKLKRRAPLPPSHVQMRDYEHFSRPS
jgi:hypothetical protein